ncbi:MAG: carboxypeptidase M32 [Candidatus Bipolaricaulota bacterium]|nr:carboxypeptidase M32 [Candidatus Bipolaricaulota bacterium]MCX7844807.1 carboxypeptidase M32 [Candidatus Bipolaricaulota bacterium]MDW8152333.1 carboxypeptidase M32 [Candidatus Bipolaricaulota bacterium]
MSALAELKSYVAEMVELQAAAAIAHWDARTYMPERGVETRAKVVGRLSRLAFERVVSPKFGELLAAAEKELPNASEAERAMVRMGKRDHERARAIPPDFYQRFVELCTKAESVWEKAKAEANFALFRPYLAEIVDMVREMARLIGYKEHPYDALLEEYEPGMTTREVAGILGGLRERLVPFVRELQERGTPPPPIPAGRYRLPSQKALCTEVLKAIGYDFSAGRLDESAHPFTIGLGPGDTRVTNRYNEAEPFSALYGALHEGGHALYDQGIPPELYWMGLAGGASYGIHESQSRFWENQIGRSLAFWEFFKPRLARRFRGFARTSPETIFRMVNKVEPSLIRVEADEVTYNLHICLRFELEVELLEGRLKVEDLPERWNAAMKAYLGVVPPDDAKGVLQDVHWSGGAFGYFPSYALGNLYAAQFMEKLQEAQPNLWDEVRKGQFQNVLSWLRQNIHRYGRMYFPEELCQKVTGEKLSPEPFLRYLREKYALVYRL